MISIEECKKYLVGLDLSDKQVEVLRDSLYAIVEQVLDKEFVY